MKRSNFYLLVVLIAFAMPARADYSLGEMQSLWRAEVNGNTVSFSSWGGAGWYFGSFDASAYNSIVVTFNSAAQQGNLQVYYVGDTDPETKIDFAAGDTRVSANLNASRKYAVEKIVLSCQSGTLTVTSAYFSGQSGQSGQSGDSGQSDNTTPYVSGDHGFVVYGTTLLDAKNNPFVIRGTNLAYAWFAGYGFRNQIAQMRTRGANSVRLAVGCGAQYNKVNASTLSSIIGYCEQQKMILILDVHDFTGVDSESGVSQAADYWCEMASVLKGHEHTVIINIANEWSGQWNQSGWVSAYSSAVVKLRNAGLHHCLMIDTDGWGQHASTIATKGSQVLNADPDKNIIFSIHMYGTAGAHGVVETNINNVLNNNLCLCIGEFGWYHSDGDVDEDAIISVCKQKQVGWCSWSWWGNSGGVEYLDMVTDQNSGTPATQSTNGQTCAWGQKIYNAWAADSKLCTVYTSDPAQPDPFNPAQGIEQVLWDAETIHNGTNNTTHKSIIHGQVVIIRDGVAYTVYGTPLYRVLE